MTVETYWSGNWSFTWDSSLLAAEGCSVLLVIKSFVNKHTQKFEHLYEISRRLHCLICAGHQTDSKHGIESGWSADRNDSFQALSFCSQQWFSSFTALDFSLGKLNSFFYFLMIQLCWADGLCCRDQLILATFTLPECYWTATGLRWDAFCSIPKWTRGCM